MARANPMSGPAYVFNHIQAIVDECPEWNRAEVLYALIQRGLFDLYESVILRRSSESCRRSLANSRRLSRPLRHPDAITAGTRFRQRGPRCAVMLDT